MLLAYFHQDYFLILAVIYSRGKEESLYILNWAYVGVDDESQVCLYFKKFISRLWLLYPFSLVKVEIIHSLTISHSKW